MGNYLNPGNEYFQIRLKNSFYVDKTGLIDLTNERIFADEKRFVCVSRPRRFGKSVAADMLTAYYGRGCDSKEMFKDFEIAKCADFEEHLNRYNVIRLDITKFINRAENIPGMIEVIGNEIVFELKTEYPDIQVNGDHLMTWFEEVYNKTGVPFVFVIDEWDCVIRERANDKDGQEKYLEFLCDLLKGRKYVALCYMTGILPVKKYSGDSSLNMFDEISMTNAGAFAKYTGFTEDEVKALCDKYGRSYDGFKDWYNGYDVEGMAIYNPKSVVKSLDENNLQSYWTNTKSYEGLKDYIDTNMDDVKDTIVKMLGGEKAEVITSAFTNDISSLGDRDDVLTLLIHLGYLTYEKDIDGEKVWIPNREVRQQFVDTIRKSDYGDVTEMLKSSKELLKATLAMDGEKVAALLDKAHSANTSFLTYNNEAALSSVISIAYYSAAAYYGVVREMPAGKGFADMEFLPKPEVPGYATMVVAL